MKKKVIKYEAGQVVKMLCSACDGEMGHMVDKVTKLGKLTKASCTECETVSTYRRGKKVSIEIGRPKAGIPYEFSHKYQKGQAIMHPTFGQGEVTEVVDSQKIDVLFGDDKKRLIHGRD